MSTFVDKFKKNMSTFVDSSGNYVDFCRPLSTAVDKGRSKNGRQRSTKVEHYPMFQNYMINN